MPIITADFSSGWTEAIQQRRKSLLLRLGMGVATALVFSPVIGLTFTTLWVTGYFIVQMLDLWLFGPVNAGRVQSISPLRYLAGSVMLVLNSAYFGSLSVALWLGGGAMGGVCAAILMSSGAIYSVVNSRRSQMVLALTLAPQFLYLAATPLFMAYFGASASFSTAAAVAIGVFMTYCLVTSHRMEASRRSEAQALEAAERKRIEAEKILEGRQAFMATIGHDLRTPISAILAGAGVLQSGAQDNQTRNQAELITDAGMMMKALLDDLLDHAKIEAGRMSVDAEDFNLRSLLAQTLRLWQGPVASKGLKLRVEGSAQLPALVRGDAMRLRQVLNNLISNAVKFTENGSITLKLRAWKEEPSGHAVLIEVRDTGPGMSSDQVARLFNPFDQTTSGISARHGGTGLGLAISRQLTELMGGRLTAHSRPGAGASFVVALSFAPSQSTQVPRSDLDQTGRLAVARALGGQVPPVAATTPAPQSEVEPVSAATLLPEPEPQADPAEALFVEPSDTRDAAEDLFVESTPDPDAVAEEEDDTAMRVLVVDDHDINRRAIQLILQPMGCEITTAADGMLALKACEAQAFDLIFMDVRMPELDGRETTRRLRASGNANADVPVIAVTADTSPEDIIACGEAGMTYFVPKPITPATLLGAITHVMNGETIESAGQARQAAVA